MAETPTDQPSTQEIKHGASIVNPRPAPKGSINEVARVGETTVMHIKRAPREGEDNE